ncbi:3',5'-cyclic-nucleotide phosphodiesterase pde1 [Microbotryomycetes sp. JL221]|nr:3',5'-cyclic-nucleotide phosphodiesterase pde1 [Microbotryomycetes sp. JL221]
MSTDGRAHTKSLPGVPLSSRTPATTLAPPTLPQVPWQPTNAYEGPVSPLSQPIKPSNRTTTSAAPSSRGLTREQAINQAKLTWEDRCNVVRLQGHHTDTEDTLEFEAAFDVLVIGCGGGPLETNLSSYLVKPYSQPWTAGSTSLEGGSTMGAIATLIEQFPHSFAGFDLKLGVDFEEQQDLWQGLPPPVPSKEPGKITRPSRNQKRQGERQQRTTVGVGREGGGRAAGRVWDTIRCFAVTHAHLDHIQGLIISSGASLEPRPLYGLPRTLGNIDRVFDGGVWPKLAGYESDGVTVGRAYLYRPINSQDGETMPLSPGLSFTALPVSHGMDPSMFHAAKRRAMQDRQQGTNGHDADVTETYDSTAFFVKESVTGKDYEFLFFGDVEPDSISKRPLTRHVWTQAAPKIVDRKLSVIFLECSYPTTQPTEKLWGHLSPPFMLEELETLAELVVKERRGRGWQEDQATRLPLKGVTVIIIHIKDDILPLPESSATKSSPRQSSPPRSHDTTSSSSITSSRDQSPAGSRDGSDQQRHSIASTVRPLSQLTMSPPEPSVPNRRPSTTYVVSPFSWDAKRRWLDANASPSTLDSDTAMTRRGSKFWNGQTPISKLIHARPSLSPSSTARILSEIDEHEARNSRSKSLPDVAERESNSSQNVTDEQTAQFDLLNLIQRGDLNSSVSSLEDVGFETRQEIVMEEETVHERIERELIELEQEKQLGVKFLRAEQGMRIVF